MRMLERPCMSLFQGPFWSWHVGPFRAVFLLKSCWLHLAQMSNFVYVPPQISNSQMCTDKFQTEGCWMSLPRILQSCKNVQASLFTRQDDFVFLHWCFWQDTFFRSILIKCSKSFRSWTAFSKFDWIVITMLPDKSSDVKKNSLSNWSGSCQNVDLRNICVTTPLQLMKPKAF